MEKEYLVVKKWVIKELLPYFEREVVVNLLHKHLTLGTLEKDDKLNETNLANILKLCQVILTSKREIIEELSLPYTLMHLSQLEGINNLNFRLLEKWAERVEKDIFNYSAKVSRQSFSEADIEKNLTPEQWQKYQELEGYPELKVKRLQVVSKYLKKTVRQKMMAMSYREFNQQIKP